MVNKSLQRERMMRYFIDACKVVIHREGLEGVTAKKVGIESGYSYATLYNYFENLDVLIYYCCVDYSAELVKNVEQSIDESMSEWEQLRTSLSVLTKFCVNNTLEFKLIFMMHEKQLDLRNVPVELRSELNNPKLIELFYHIHWNIAKLYGKSQKEFELSFEICVSFSFKKLYFNTFSDEQVPYEKIVDSIMEIAHFVLES